MFKKLKLSAVGVDECKNAIDDILSKEDNYGNNALALACIYHNDLKKDIKRKCVQFLLSHGSNPNVRNRLTGFTPLHWACLYNEEEIVDMLHEHGAVSYIPDTNGYCPLDYAGKFGYQNIMAKLIILSWNKVRETHQERIHKDLSNNILKKMVKHNSDNFSKLNTFEQSDFLVLSEAFQTNLLYWACCLPENMFNYKLIEAMIKELRVYPEGNIHSSANRTPVHAAAIGGNIKKLKVLMRDIDKRYFSENTDTKQDFQCHIHESDLSEDNLIQIDSHNHDGLQNDHKSLEQYRGEKIRLLLKNKAFKGSLKIYMEFMNNLQRKDQEKRQNKFSKDFKDDGGYSPLHYACQLNQKECAKFLLMYHCSSLDVTAETGVRPRDLIQHDDIKRMFQIFYQKVDSAIKKESQNKSGQFSALVQDSSIDSELAQKKDDESRARKKKLFKTMSKDDGGLMLTKEEQEDKLEKLCLENILSFHTDNNKKDINLIKQALKHRHKLPEISQFAMKIKLDRYQQQKVDNTIETLIQSNFIVKLFPTAEAINSESCDNYFLVLELTLNDLEIFAEQMQYHVKLMEESLKMQFIKSQKHKFEPFRTKDIQDIYKRIIEKILPLEELERCGILIQMFCVHDMNAIDDIEFKILQSSPITYLKENFKEHSHQEYHATTALKNYFGERIGFLYQFNFFYTSWLIIPAGLGLGVTIRDIYYKEFISLWSYLYSTSLSLWITIFIEAWKRKQNQMRLLWGTLIEDIQNEETVRRNFEANEEFDMDKMAVNRVQTRIEGYIYRILNRVLIFVLLSLTVATFLWTEVYYVGIFSGIINGAIAGGTDAIYKTFAEKLNDLENHKYESDYNNSFIKKTFFFKFTNANITIIWKIINTTEDFDHLYQFIFGIVINKVVTLTMVRTVVSYITYRIQKFRYFQTCKEKAAEQKVKHDNQLGYMKKTSEKDHDEFSKIREKYKLIEIFRHLREESPSKSYELRRVVTIFNRKDGKKSCIQKDEQLLVDQVELNSIMQKKNMTEQLYDISENFILFGFVSLYSFICPPISMIVFIYNVVALRAERWAHLRLQMRNFQIKENGLGAWLTVLSFLGYTTVIANGLFLYRFRHVFAMRITQIFDFFLPYLLDTGDLTPFENLGVLIKNIPGAPALYESTRLIIEEQEVITSFLFFLVISEHLVLGVKIYIDVMIGDIPGWVSKRQQQIQKVMYDMNQILKGMEQDELIKKLNKKNTQDENYQVQNKLMIMDNENLKNQILELKQKAFQGVSKVAQKSSTLPPINGVRHGSLTTFLEERLSRSFSRPEQAGLEFSLNRQLQIRLFRETFMMIEKQLIQMRLCNLSSMASQRNQAIMCVCIECEKNLAIVQCHGCDNDYFCKDCFDSNHKTTHKHKTSQLSLFDAQVSSPINNVQNIKSMLLGDVIQEDKHQSNIKTWHKFELFNFILSENSDLFIDLRRFFTSMKTTYLKMNNISDVTQKADFVKMMVDQNYSLVKGMLEVFDKERQGQADYSLLEGINDREIDSRLKKQPDATIGMQKDIRSNQFNIEELIFLNRISFICLCKDGPGLQFKNFITQLSSLQNGTFEQKISIILEILKEGRENQQEILFEDFVHFICSSMPQSLIQGEKGLEELRKLFNGRNYVSIEELKTKICNLDKSHNNSRLVLECVLQC